MKRTLVICMVLLATALLAPASPKRSGKAGGDVREQLKQMEKDRAAAVIKADIGTLDRLTSDDYEFTDSRGQVRNKQEMLDAIKSGQTKLQSNDLDDLKVSVYGDTAVVTGKSTAKGTLGGQPVTGPIRFMRVLVKRGGQWKCVAFQQTKIGE